MRKIKIWNWILDFFGASKTIDLKSKTIEDLQKKIAIETFALNVGANMIAGTISKCEFKTYVNGKFVKDDEYYLWNIQPNKNQNSTEFLQEVIYKLIFENEVLIFEVAGELFAADGFDKEVFATKEHIFKQVYKDDFTFDKTFYMSDVIYLKLNNQDIRNTLDSLINTYTDVINTSIDKYKKSGGRKGIVRLDAGMQGDEKYKASIDEMFNNGFKKYFNSVNAILNLPKGVDYTEHKQESGKTTSEVNDINNLIKEAFDRVSQALRIPPALLKGEIADISHVTDNYLTFCIDPSVEMIQEEIIRKRYGKENFKKGTYLKIDTTSIKHIDVFSIAEKIDKLIASGMYDVDELRLKVGDDALNTEWSKKHFITKNYQEITTLEGGEEN